MFIFQLKRGLIRLMSLRRLGFSGVIKRLRFGRFRILKRISELEKAVSEQRDWNLLLERLLTGTTVASSPGAIKAAANLGDPVVAVIIATYNRAPFVVEAVASVQRQSFQNWEMVIVDDGSSDDTAAVIAPFLSDKRIRYIKQQNAGCSNARNRGIRETSAPILAYLDSDNLWYPNFLARAVDCLEAEPDVDLVYGALIADCQVPGRHRILWKPFDRNKLLGSNFIDSNIIAHRRSLVARFGDWDEAASPLQDWDLMLRYTVDKPARPLDVIAAYYRVCDGQRLSVVVPPEPASTRIRQKWINQKRSKS